MSVPDPALHDWVPIYAPGPAPISYSTTLPASPIDGQEAILVDSVTNPSWQWRFRYNADSTSAYKWEFVGGASAYQFLAASGGLLAGWNASQPTIAAPRAGEYSVDAAALFVMDTNKLIGFGIWAAGGVLPGSASHATSPQYQGMRAGHARLTLAAGATVMHAVYAASVGTSYYDRTLHLLPVRVS